MSGKIFTFPDALQVEQSLNENVTSRWNVTEIINITDNALKRTETTGVLDVIIRAYDAQQSKIMYELITRSLADATITSLRLRYYDAVEAGVWSRNGSVFAYAPTSGTS